MPKKKVDDIVQASNITSDENPKNRKRSRTNKLTQAKINQFTSKFNTKRTVRITVEGEDFEVLINETFAPSEVEDACLEFIEMYARACQIDGIDVKNLVKNTENFMKVYVLKKFTDLPIPDTDDISKIIVLTKNLHNLGILSIFFDNEETLGKRNLELVSNVFNKMARQIGQLIGNKTLLSEIRKIAEERIDVDNYFSELELRNFDITEDEDLTLLPKVIDQLQADGLYEKYMSTLTSDELDKIKLRLEILNSLENRE